MSCFSVVSSNILPVSSPYLVIFFPSSVINSNPSIIILLPPYSIYPFAPVFLNSYPFGITASYSVVPPSHSILPVSSFLNFCLLISPCPIMLLLVCLMSPVPTKFSSPHLFTAENPGSSNTARGGSTTFAFVSYTLPVFPYLFHASLTYSNGFHLNSMPFSISSQKPPPSYSPFLEKYGLPFPFGATYIPVSSMPNSPFLEPPTTFPLISSGVNVITSPLSKEFCISL